jgi:hypothetical protein
MAKYFLYLFIIFVLLFALEFFKVVDVPYLEIPDWVSGTEENLQKGAESADKIQ